MEYTRISDAALWMAVFSTLVKGEGENPGIGRNLLGIFFASGISEGLRGSFAHWRRKANGQPVGFMVLKGVVCSGREMGVMSEWDAGAMRRAQLDELARGAEGVRMMKVLRTRHSRNKAIWSPEDSWS
jgi:hypothetical protein